jgi:hypothetical protein
MWEPVGPLPATVYWRRRWVAVASTIVVVLLVIWSVTAMFGTGGEDATTIRASRAALSAPEQTAPDQTALQQAAPQQASPSPAPVSADPTTPTDPAAAAAPPSSDPASAPSQPGTVGAASPASADPGTTTPGPTTPGAPATTSEELRPDETPRASVAAATPVPVPASGPVPCTNAMLTVGSEIDRPQHKVGDKPVLRLVVTNTSGEPCVRDLDSARQEIVVWNSNQSVKLWSSNDCSNVHSTDLRTLVPGQPVAFAVTWAGRTSTPGCAQPRTVVPAGNYRVLTRLDDIISPPTLFVLTP